MNDLTLDFRVIFYIVFAIFCLAAIVVLWDSEKFLQMTYTSPEHASQRISEPLGTNPFKYIDEANGIKPLPRKRKPQHKKVHFHKPSHPC
ncbi:MAG: hypothetical protein HAW67_01165 [Endozoicomonadaceae bacterium]|nr:hypothetical protein [Endozoicomonadaceae bacterium]